MSVNVAIARPLEEQAQVTAVSLGRADRFPAVQPSKTARNSAVSKTAGITVGNEIVHNR